MGSFLCIVGYPFDSGDHNILWLAIGGPRKGLPIAPRFQACDGHGACVILDRPETQPRGPIACRPASGAPGCILGAVCWRPWIDQTTTPRGYLSQVDTPFVYNCLLGGLGGNSRVMGTGSNQSIADGRPAYPSVTIIGASIWRRDLSPMIVTDDRPDSAHV